jgi:dihydroorotase
MPNTEPPIDNAAVIDFIRRRSEIEGQVRVFPIGCVTKGRAGKELAEMEELASAGAVAFSDDGDPVYDANLMRLALAYSLDLGLPISNHRSESTSECRADQA